MERENRFGVYFILKSMEVGPSFRITMPKYPTSGPDYRIVGSQRGRPKFSRKERAAVNLDRHYSIQQVEYCWNFIFKRNFPIHKLFERSCDIGLFRLTADKITRIFGFRLHKKLRGKLQTVLEKIEHGHHVFRACAKNAVLRMYEKFSTFLRLEVLSNNLRDFGQKSL
jgi:hypothetical protein